MMNPSFFFYILILYLGRSSGLRCDEYGTGQVARDGQYAYWTRCYYDGIGGDLPGSPIKAHDYQACIKACSANPSCKSLTHVPTKGWCYLKSGLTTYKSGQSVDFAFRSQCVDPALGGTYRGFRFDCGKQISGNTLSQLSGLTFTDCIDRCTGTSACLAIQYVNSDHTCLLKSSTSVTYGDGNSDVAFTKSCSDFGNGAVLNGFDLKCGYVSSAPDIQTIPQITFEGCVTRCKSEQACVVASYNRDSSTCYFKGQYTDINPRAMSDVAIRPDTRTCANFGDGTVLEGFDLKCSFASSAPTIRSISKIPFHECVLQCKVDQICVLSSYDRETSTCFLKGQYTDINARTTSDIAMRPDPRTCTEMGNSTALYNFDLKCGFTSYEDEIDGYIRISFAKCVALCGEQAECVVASYNRDAKACSLKGKRGSIRSTPTEDVAIKWVANSCMPVDGKLVSDRYQVSCKTNNDAPNMFISPAHDFVSCQDACNKLAGCRSFQYRETDGMCYYKSAIGNFGSTSPEERSYDLAWTSTPFLPDDANTCRSLDSQGQDRYEILCKKTTSSEEVAPRQLAYSFRDCLARCDQIPGCSAALFTRDPAPIVNQPGPGWCNFKRDARMQEDSETMDLAYKNPAYVDAGCFIDFADHPQMNTRLSDDADNTPENCAARCNESYRYSGTEAGVQCFCSNVLPTNQAENQSECNAACSGNQSLICGGSTRLSVLENVRYVPPVDLPIPVPTTTESCACYFTEWI